MQIFDTTIPVSANQSSPGQGVDFDAPVAGAVEIINNSGISIQYATDGATWFAVANGSTATVGVANPAAFRLRKVASDSYPVTVRLRWGTGDGGASSTEAASRSLTAADDGLVLECTATITITVPAGLPRGFACAIIPSGTTSIASSGGALLNGATGTLTRAAAANAMFAIQARASAVDSYVVSGT